MAINGVRTVRVGVYDNKPKVYRDNNGLISGLFPDILNYISKQENWQLEYVFGTWEEGLTRLEKGKIDVMVDVAISEERKKQFDFTNETILSSWGVVFVDKNSTIKSFLDLDGKKIAILQSSVYFGGPDGIDTYTKAFDLKVEFVNVHEYAEVFNLLNKGEVDAAVVSRIFALTNKQNYPNIKETDIFFKPTELRFALTKGNRDNPYLIERVDDWVKKLKEGYEGVYQQSLESHGLGGMLISKEVTPQWVIPVGFVVTAILFLSFLIIIRLIRKRLISVRELQESEEKFSKVFKTSPYAITITKTDGAFIEANDAFNTLTGFTQKEILTNSLIWLKLWVNEKDRQEVVGELSLGHNVVGKEYQFRMKNGEIRTGLYSAQMVRLHGKPQILSSINDITDRKKAEEAIRERTEELENLNKRQEDTQKALLNIMADLREITARNEAILESIANGVIVVNRSGIIILMNRYAEKLLGWKIHEAVGNKWFEILKREDEQGNPLSPEKGAIRNALVDGTTSLPFIAGSSYYYVRKNGSKFPVARTVSPIILGKKIIGAVAVFRDFTSQKELDKMKDEFMDIAAHDLRTPATAIRGFISRVLDGDVGKIPDKAKELLKAAYEGNMRSIKLVDDFLVVSRLERGKIKINPHVGDLSSIIETSVSELLGLAESKGLTLDYKKVKLPTVLVDEERIIQIVNNLIENAIKFTEKGGITISHQIDRDEVITNITDTGIGISSDSQKQLFRKYYKSGEVSTRSGLGLGLYICKLNIEGLGGKIWVKSQEGKGSTFSFSLPVAK